MIEHNVGACDWVQRAHGGEELGDQKRRLVSVAAAIASPWNLQAVEIGHNEGFEFLSDWGLRIRLKSSLSTHDNDVLTRLVVAAHAYFVRVEISPMSMYSVDVTLTVRDPNLESLFEGHASLGHLAKRVEDWIG